MSDKPKLKLFAVEVSTTVIVQAVDEDAAENIAQSLRREIFDNSEWDFCAGMQIETDRDADNVSEGWSGAIPYSETGEQRIISDILAADTPVPTRCADTIDMFGGDA